MTFNPDNPLIVQADKTILLETSNSLYEEVRDNVGRFAELEKSPEYIHTYRISPLSLWNAAAGGMDAEKIIGILAKYSKYDLPQNILRDIEDYISRYGKVKLTYEHSELILQSDDKYIIKEISRHKKIEPFLKKQLDEYKISVDEAMRGHIKHALIKLGFPVEDLAGYTDGTPFEVMLRTTSREGKPIRLRDYQRQAVQAFYQAGTSKGGSGVLVLPCGAGKTVAGMAVMEQVKAETLILTTNITALRQWKNELLDKTTIASEHIGEYSGEVKEIKPVTVTTYQILTYRQGKRASFPHLEIFNRKNWGLIIYDEVHLLPAPVFRITAELQSKRRLGLTATLVREDGLEEDVFSLIGPKKYDIPWKVLEKQGWIASASCVEIRIPMPEDRKMAYATSGIRQKFRIASENKAKIPVIGSLLKKHPDDLVLVIGQYIEQLEEIAVKIGAPLITGKTPNDERIKLYEEFKRGRIKRLIVSKVANFALDLPDANVAIQVSGTFGSRQEEAQRLGRILRPKAAANQAFFYSLVTRDSREQDFAGNRQMFLTEQGYKYYIKTETELEEQKIGV